MINYDLKGRVAIVTGGASGIGFACAELLAKSGASVAIWDLKEESLSKAKASLSEIGTPIHTIAVDVSNSKAVADATAETVATLGSLDILVNNAGISGAPLASADYSDDDWRKVMAVNLDGAFFCQREAINVMKKTGGGSIINMASILGQVGFATAPAYTTSKHAIVGMTKSAAMEYAADGIRVNTAGPGFIHTPLVDYTLDDETQAFLANKHALNRLGKPEEVAHLVAWLASDGSSFVTGAYYPVDGGYLAQ